MAEVRKKLAIIDGKSVFYRGYYAMPNLSTKDGTPTGGVYGFAAMALELIKKLQPDYVCVAWDKPKTNIRKRLEIYPEYKAGRKPPPPDFYAQIPILHELLEAFNWPLLEMDDYEADDIMGALAVQAKKKDMETMLITSDLDMLQLVNSHTKVYALKKGFSNIEEYHLDSFTDKYCLEVNQFLDLKALKGDSSDNIPGVPGIGEKIGIGLLQEYKTLDGVYENLDLIKESVRKKLEAGKESAYLSKRIAEIWIDAPVKLDFKAMDARKLDTKALQDLLQKLEFRSLLDKLPGTMQVGSRAHNVSDSKLVLPSHTLVESDKDLAKLKLEGTDIYIHTRAAGRHGSDPKFIILGDAKQAYTLDLSKLNLENVQKALTSVFKDVSLIGYDVKSDIELLKGIGVKAPTVSHDVLIAAFLINSLLRAQSPVDLAESELNYHTTSFSDTPNEDVPMRAPEAVALLRDLKAKQQAELSKMPKVAKLAKEIEYPLLPVLADMEYTGIQLDTGYLKKFAVQLEGSISDLEQQIYGYADQEFNISSPAQLADILFVTLALPTKFVKKGKTGYSTAANELAKLRTLHPIIDLISQYREVVKLKNTYVDTLPEQVDKNSRLHTTFNLTVAPTGRLSSADPNLQNIPVKTDLGRNIRTAFVAGKGNVLVSADYSQFELRLAAALSGDKDMIDAFNRDADIHAETAAQIYGIDAKDVTKTQRSSVKAVNFGILYGLGPHALSESTGMTFAEAREFIAKYFEIRPKLKVFIEHTRKQALEQGYVETLLGRRRPTPDVQSSNFQVREAAYRSAVNMPLQGTAADIMKLAMIKVQENFDQMRDERLEIREASSNPKSQIPNHPVLLLQIHDSILIECREEQAEAVAAMVKEIMENTYTKLPVKLTADTTHGKNWGEL